MNKFIKFLIAVLGGINITFSIFIPIAVSLLIINVFGYHEVYSTILLIAGIIASLYRGIDVGILRS